MVDSKSGMMIPTLLMLDIMSPESLSAPEQCASLGLRSSPVEGKYPWVVRNLDPWYSAYNVQPGQKLYLAPQQRVRIW